MVSAVLARKTHDDKVREIGYTDPAIIHFSRQEAHFAIDLKGNRFMSE
jgi:hypothetical protein